MKEFRDFLNWLRPFSNKVGATAFAPYHRWQNHECDQLSTSNIQKMFYGVYSALIRFIEPQCLDLIQDKYDIEVSEVSLQRSISFYLTTPSPQHFCDLQAKFTDLLQKVAKISIIKTY
jgi:hypothetical protein